MTRSVLVPLDGSRFAEQALPLALVIARAERAKLRLVLVHQKLSPPMDKATARLARSMDLALRKAERDYLRGVVEMHRGEASRQVVGVTIAGPVAPTLLKYIREIGPDLVVMTTHGRGGIQRAWLGSIADQLIRSVEIPTILVRPAEGEGAAAVPVSEILVCLDGSPSAEGVLEPVAALAGALDARLGLLQVVPPVPLMTDPMLAYATSFDERLTAIHRQQAEEYLAEIAGQMRDAGLQASARVITGASVAEAIFEAARREPVGMLAVATHGRGGLRRMVLGSVADKLVRGAEKPILVVRRRKPPRPRTARRG
jgi:nucleotide-binding universal stress UspA family protein